LSGKLLLYSREKCPLCDKAKLMLEDIKRELGIQYEEIDIYSRDELTELYGLMIPVVEWRGEILQYGQIDKEKLCQCIIKK
jgi:hypothetical protein